MKQGRISLATTNHKCDTEIVGPFLSMYPDVNLRLTQNSLHEKKIELLQEGELDFCITTLPIDHPEVESIDFLTEEIFLAVPSGHRLSKRKSISLYEVANEPFIGLDEKNSFRILTDDFCKRAGFKPKLACEVDDSTVVSTFVKEGMGIAFLAEIAKVKEPSLILLPIEQPDCRRIFRLAWRKNHYLSKVAHAFRDFIIQYYASH
ncbi:LysR substrate-binding domain-containing protein [Shimazuella kribbensis]|uniref:LysR substrate-binding domain-containing protein n=1 Tax=Shimazuella kribbensis TaxID=139808 RepID=UPI000421183F|nr:LysR substrate-binding domain-containing protein [Shimazuella kribbensis]